VGYQHHDCRPTNEPHVEDVRSSSHSTPSGAFVVEWRGLREARNPRSSWGARFRVVRPGNDEPHIPQDHRRRVDLPRSAKAGMRGSRTPPLRGRTRRCRRRSRRTRRRPSIRRRRSRQRSSPGCTDSPRRLVRGFRERSAGWWGRSREVRRARRCTPRTVTVAEYANRSCPRSVLRFSGPSHTSCWIREGCIYSGPWHDQRASPWLVRPWPGRGSGTPSLYGPWGPVWPDNVHETGVLPVGQCGFRSEPPRPSRSSELEERPGHGQDPSF
jgi:hypothetical protein